MNLAIRPDFLDQTHGAHLAIHGDRNVRAKPPYVEQPFANAGPRAIHIVDDLAYCGALRLHLRPAAR